MTVASGVARGVARGTAGNGSSGGSTPLLLDTYTSAAAAWSLRQIKNAATSAIRVRRSSDDAELDIGFVDGALDTATLLTHCGAGDGFVAKWYDQEGTNHLVQATALSQMQIVDTGSLITDNGKPSIRANASGQSYSLTSTIDPSATGWTAFHVVKRDDNGQLYALSAAAGDTPVSIALLAATYFFGNSANYENVTGVTSDQQLLTSANTSAGVMSLRKNGSDVSLLAETPYGGQTVFSMFGYSGSAVARYHQEVVIWLADKSANQVAIENNMLTYWGIA